MSVISSSDVYQPHALGGIAQLVVLHIFAEHHNRMRFDDAFEEIDHAMELSERLGFRCLELMQGFELSVHGRCGVLGGGR